MSTVARVERSRLLEAMLEELVEKGYPAVEIEGAAHRASLVGEQWSAQFSDKDACLVAAFDELAEQLRAAIAAGCRDGTDWPSRVAGGLRSLLTQLAERSEMAEGLARAFPAIGPAAQRRYHGFIESFGPLLTEGRDFSPFDLDLPEDIELLALGAAEAILFEQIQAGRAAGLRALVPEVLFSVLVNFLGAGPAAMAMEREREVLEAVARG